MRLIRVTPSLRPGIIFKRHHMTWLLPPALQSHIKYNPRHLPVIPIKVGWQPASKYQWFPSAYWYVANRELLWSCFEKFGLVVQRRGDC